MSWRTVTITKRCKLEYRMGYLVVRDEDIVRVHLSEIAVLILESTAISMTTSLISELVKRKIKVIFCDASHNPQSELVAYYGCHDSSRRIRQQIHWDPALKEIIWQQIVKDKIRKQSHVLKRYHHDDEARLLEKYLNEVECNDASNREGHAAKVYFNALFGIGFSREQDHPINAALNYGYALILAVTNREITAQGCLTQVGIWHSNTFNAFNLGSDLMEVFRPLVDLYVLEMDLEEADSFGAEEKHSMQTILEQEVLLNGTKQKLINAQRLYVQQIIKILDAGEISSLPLLTYA